MIDNTYDQLPYPTLSHPSAHVRKLEAVATLFGMQPKSISECRVLELGCAAGTNLIPQACEFPQSHFVGVELSERQVADGRTTITGLGLKNVELRQANILNIRPEEPYDYILCHGVFSWVPREVQDKIVEICHSQLAPNGVALVSYNVLPGWNFRRTIRDMMLYHTGQFEQPAEQVSQARAVLDFMAENCPADTAYGQMLRDELELVQGADDQYLFHDHLEVNNDPIYFHQFVERAEARELRYLGDTNVASMIPKFHSKKAQQILANVPLVKQEQYMDFLRNSAFRDTLLCHRDIELTRNLDRAALRKFHVSLSTLPEVVESPAGKSVKFRFGEGTISTSEPLPQFLIHLLTERWPRAISLEELKFAVHERTSTDRPLREQLAGIQVDDISAALMEIFAAGLLEIYVHPPAITNRVSRLPQATRLARQQAEWGGVTNQRHENVTLDELSRRLVAMLDGEHSVAQSSEMVQSALAAGDLAMRLDNQETDQLDPKVVDALVANALDRICDAALLTA